MTASKPTRRRFTASRTATLTGLYLLIAVEGLLIAEALPRIWDPETQALFAAVMSFWFGNRTLSKLRERH